MRAIPRIVIAVLAMMLCFSTIAIADHGHGDNDRASVVPAYRVGGSSGGELVGDWFTQVLALPAAENPFVGNAELCLNLGRHDKVFAPAGGEADENGAIEMSCTIEFGRPVIIVMSSADCSSAEAPPYYGGTFADQRRCVVKAIKGLPIVSLPISVNGSPSVDIHQPRYLAVSPQERVVFPEGAVFDATSGPATFVSAAWIAEIRGLGRGEHTVNTSVNYLIEGEHISLPYIVHLKIVGRR